MWVDPDQYHLLAEDDQVRPAHSVCTDCYEALVEPMLRLLETRRAAPAPNLA